MWNEPTEKQLQSIPAMYSTQDKNSLELKIHEHFFIGGCDWYAAEYDPNDRQFFGYTILNGDRQNAEWGYFSFDELREINIQGFQVDRDLYWEPQKAGGIEKIVKLE